MEKCNFAPMEIRKKRNFGLLLACCLLLLSCSSPKVPDNAKSVNQLPSIYPDYTEVTVPANICPMNFMLTDGSEEAVARLTVGGLSYVAGTDCKLIVDEGQWQELRDAARGKSISIEVFGRKGEQWTAYKPFNIYVADDDIDEYISFRLIRPSYVVYDELSIVQRNLTNFDESDIYNNKLVMKENEGHCINCHSYRNYNPDSLLFHMRQSYGGTMIACDGKLQKVDLKTDSTLSAGVYPAWHPTIDVIAFSTNLTAQLFYLHGEDKVEVFDSESDLILYDLNKKEVSHISNAPDEMEVFPTWSPDGKTLYYCSAHFEYAEDTVKHEVQILSHLNELHYNLYARSFDPKTRKFGEPRLIYDAASRGKSVTLPRVSPDGKYIAFAQGRQGCFQIWHNDADIMVKHLSPSPLKGDSGFGSGSEPGLKGQSQGQSQS
ncbi:MAG: PD40 domain-containing protein, partial [Bacteroidaceae bacterium]|nr:PD40 domain-containing protein [Bacteroidaceae bacterium]